MQGDQDAFRRLADYAHTLGLTDHHQVNLPDDPSPMRPGDPEPLRRALRDGVNELVVRFPQHAEIIRDALTGYYERAREHDQRELCHFCLANIDRLGEATAEFYDSGWAAELCRVLKDGPGAGA